MSDEILQGLQDLQVESQIDVDSDPDMSFFKKSKKKKKKKDKLYSEIDSILDDDSDSGDDDMFVAMGFKSKKRDDEDVDGDIFDTNGKKDKKRKAPQAVCPNSSDLNTLHEEEERYYGI